MQAGRASHPHEWRLLVQLLPRAVLSYWVVFGEKNSTLINQSINRPDSILCSFGALRQPMRPAKVEAEATIEHTQIGSQPGEEKHMQLEKKRARK